VSYIQQFIIFSFLVSVVPQGPVCTESTGYPQRTGSKEDDCSEYGGISSTEVDKMGVKAL